MTNHDMERRPDGENGYPASGHAANGYGGHAGHAGPAPGRAATNKSLLLILWRGAWLIVLLSLVCIVAAFFYLAKATPIYSSTARILVEKEVQVMPGGGIAEGQGINYLATQCELIKSTSILAPVAERPEIRQMKTFGGIDNPVVALKAGLTAEVSKTDDLLNVSYESPYPTEAADIVNAVVESYRTYYASRKKSTAAEILRILTKEKKDADKDFQAKNQEVLEFRQKNPALFNTVAEKGNIVVEQLGKLSDALTAAHLDALEAKGTFDGAKAMAGQPERMAQWMRLQQGSPAAAQQQAQIQDLEAQLAQLHASNILDRNTQVRALQAKLDGLRANVQDQSQQAFEAYLAAVEARYLSAQQREQELQKNFDDQQRAALSLNTESAKLDSMLAEERRLEKLCDLLDERIKQVKITEDVGAINVSVLEFAKPGLSPVKPKRASILFECLVLGLMLGGALAYLRDWMDHRLNSAEEIREMLGLGVLGVLPNMPGKQTPMMRGQKVQLDPMSDVAEGYRTVRTAIYFGAPEGKTKTILITSPAPGDGKTTTASNLAIAMAQAGQKVLLMDADFRRPTQHKVFNVDDQVGTTSVLAEQAQLAEAIKPTETPGLSILPCGPLPKNPSEILQSRAFSRLIEQLEERFDHIVIDSPPVMPVTDARILGALCDLTVLVLRAQKSSRRISMQARDSLASVGARVLGVVVNDVPRSRGGYGYGYGYGYYTYGYRYGYGNRKPTHKAIEGRTDGARLPAAAPD